MSDHTPTAEQTIALAAFATGQSLAIEAGAGTGKTSTLVMLARSTDRRGRYIAFNKAIVTEAGAKFPSNVDCSTAHSLAYRAIVSKRPALAERLRSSRRMRTTEIADRLGIDPIRLTLPTGETKRLSKSLLAGLAMRGVAKFCQSADLEPSERHVPYIDGIDLPPARRGENNRQVARALVGAMRTAWADLSDDHGSLPFKHDHYLKLWHLSGPKIGADFILFDEAQDANPVLVDIVRQQTHAQLVWVGDSQQSIYGFTGAVNALQTVGAEQTAYLSQSFRFGPAIAAVANRCLAELDADLRIKGLGSIASVVSAVSDPDVILCRTNATALRELLDAIEAGLRPHLVGGGRELADFAQGVKDLQTDGFTAHAELACFGSWDEVVRYVSEDEAGGELRLLVKLIDEFGVDAILDALARMPEEGDADVVISTAHKSKGREWPVVRLAGDFPAQPGEDELRLLYVAVTRAKLTLDISAVDYFRLGAPIEVEVDHAAADHDHADCAVCIAEAREADRESDEALPAAVEEIRIVEQIATGSGPTREQIEAEMVEARELLAARARATTLSQNVHAAALAVDNAEAAGQYDRRDEATRWLVDLLREGSDEDRRIAREAHAEYLALRSSARSAS